MAENDRKAACTQCLKRLAISSLEASYSTAMIAASKEQFQLMNILDLNVI